MRLVHAVREGVRTVGELHGGEFTGHGGVCGQDRGALLRSRLDQGSGENNIIVGVNERDYDAALQAIYREFVRED